MEPHSSGRYRFVFVAFENGVPSRVEDFVSGFLIEDGTAQFGRSASSTA